MFVPRLIVHAAGRAQRISLPRCCPAHLSALALVLACWLLAACSAGSAPEGATLATAAPPAAADAQVAGALNSLPAIAELDALARELSAVEDKTLLGDAVLFCSAQVELDEIEHVAVMHTDPVPVCWAIYKFSGFAPGQYPLSFSIERSEVGQGRDASVPPPYSIAYAAWADFDAGRWQLFPAAMPYTSLDPWTQLYPDTTVMLVSPLGNSYLAVILSGTSVEAPELRSVTLHYTGDAL